MVAYYGTFPLAHGAPARVGRLRAYGNGLCVEEAFAFIEAAREFLNQPTPNERKD